MMEAGVLLDLSGNPIYWHIPPERSGGALPDSRDLWDVIWENRERVGGFAHTHPGYGKPGPSYTDLTTFAAIEEALGKRLEWWIASGDEIVLVYWGESKGTEKYLVSGPSRFEASWLPELRRLSGFGVQNPNNQ